MATYLLIAVVSSALGPAADADQSVPVFWDSSRALQFMLSLLAVTVVAPIVEELTFRGLGFHLLSRFGPGVALFVTAVLFGLVHGFLSALPLFVIFGLGVG